MELIQQIGKMRAKARALQSTGKPLAFVPTMGALHKGHLRLIERAKGLGGSVVVSSFVNPMQFTNEQDLKNYPRDPAKDEKACRDAGVDAYFVPSVEEIYPQGFLTSVNVGYLSTKYEGASRPGHFRGVCTVVLKLLNIVRPTHLVLGLKDAQQFTIIQHMLDDLSMDVELVGVPTVRDADGLALSSRNALLTKDQRAAALCIQRALKRVHFLVKKQGILHSGELLQAIRSATNTEHVTLDYAAIVNRTTLEPLDHVMRGGTYILIAAKVGDVRLIDNTRI
ncbi:pantoate--beta-alanine ligase [Candidatus Sumerlaeota bacterium]|nr:pantoate--beta-alanine ligase [Candidatus Sumerlaeota bacterium]